MPLAAIPGQPRAVAALEAALRSGNVHHAYLFAGPAGVGKEATALALAQALLCNVKPMVGCGACPTCARVEKLSHPDLLWVMPEAEQVARKLAGRSDFDHVPSRDIRVEQLRKLQERVAFRALEGARKVALVFNAEQLNPQSQNAFLKTLEEPPSDTTLILVCSAPDKLLPTLRSRCSRLQFGPLPESYLAARLEKERQLDPKTAALVAALAGGSWQRALDQDVERLQERDALYSEFEAVTLEDLRTVLRFAETFGASREDAEEALALLGVWVHDLIALKSGVERIVNRDLLPLAHASAQRHTADTLHRRVTALEKAREAISLRNGAARVQLESMLLEMGEA